MTGQSIKEQIKQFASKIPGGATILGEILAKRKLVSMKRQIAQLMSRVPLSVGDVVVDLGANIGYFSEYCLLRGALVHAYEPDPKCYQALLRIKERFPAFEPHNAAVSHDAGTAELYRHEKYAENNALYAESSSLIKDKLNVGLESVTVPVVDIGSVLAAHERIAIVKVDIEGSEYDIYESLIKNAAKIGKVLMETHVSAIPSRKEDHDRMLERLKKEGLEDKFALDWF